MAPSLTVLLAVTACLSSPAVRAFTCNLVTETKKWADGDNLASYAGPNTDVECYARCDAFPGCQLSIRDPATGNCFLKKKSPLLDSLSLSTSYCSAAPACAITTQAQTWADGPNLASFPGPNTDAECFAKCAAHKGPGDQKCDLSVRDPSNGNCFLKAKSPLLRSLTLTTTFCKPVVCETETKAKTWADGPNLAGFAGPNTDAECFAKCAAYDGPSGKCDLSIRDPATGNCFLKKSSPLLASLTLSTTYCKAVVCETETKAKTWADGPNLAGFAGPNTDAECFAKCAAYNGPGGKCDLSIRDPATGNCFLKKSSPLLASLTLSTTYCKAAPATPPVMKCPASQTVAATSASGAVVSWAAATATDASGNVATSCDKASGVLRPASSRTDVTCTATGSTGLTSTCGFAAIVGKFDSGAGQPTRCTMVVVPDTKMSGEPSASGSKPFGNPASSREGCLKACNLSSDCATATFFPPQNKCFLYKETFDTPGAQAPASGFRIPMDLLYCAEGKPVFGTPVGDGTGPVVGPSTCGPCFQRITGRHSAVDWNGEVNAVIVNPDGNSRSWPIAGADVAAGADACWKLCNDTPGCRHVTYKKTLPLACFLKPAPVLTSNLLVDETLYDVLKPCAHTSEFGLKVDATANTCPTKRNTENIAQNTAPSGQFSNTLQRPPGVVEVFTTLAYENDKFLCGNDYTIQITVRAEVTAKGPDGKPVITGCKTCPGAKCKIWAPTFAGFYDNACAAELTADQNGEIWFTSDEPGNESLVGFGSDAYGHWHYDCTGCEKGKKLKMYTKPLDGGNELHTTDHQESNYIEPTCVSGVYQYDILLE